MLRAVGTRQTIQSGLAVNRPVASSAIEGFIYFSTDTNELEAVLGGVWVDIAASPLLDSNGQMFTSDTYANLVLDTSWPIGTNGYATDLGYGRGLRFVWSGSAWILPQETQILKYIHTDVTLPADLVENTAVTTTLPALGANDAIHIESMWTLTNNANAKTVNIKLDGTNGFTRDYASFAGTHTYNTIVNRNSASSQCWTNNNTSMFGGTANALQTTTKALGVAGKVLSMTGTKATAGDTMTLNWARIYVCGGG
jgi:hypothetical protein